MKIFSISDIHASEENVKGYQLLLLFTKKCLLENNLNQVVFLGDIFDHLVGHHLQYYQKYQKFFKLLDQLVLHTKVVFIEGNHDFNLKEFFEERYKDKILYLDKIYNVKDYQHNLVYIHGDLIDLNDLNYKIFRSLIRSRLFYLFTSYFLNFEFAEKIGNAMTKNSKKYWKDNINAKNILKKYRHFIEMYYRELPFNFLIFGHTHIKDKFVDRKFVAINNGFSTKENCFVCYKEGKVNFVNI